MQTALILAILAAIVWGLDYSLAEEIFKKKISPFTLLSLEMFFGSIFVGLISYGSHFKADVQMLLTDRRAMWLFLAILVTFSLANLLIFFSIELGRNATIVAVIEMCYPVFTVLFTWFLFHKSHLSPSLIIGGVVILIGVFIVYYFNR